MAAWRNLSEEEKAQYDSRKDYRQSRKAGEVFETEAADTSAETEAGDEMQAAVIRTRGPKATHMYNKKGDLTKITEKNNPFKGDINKFDTTALGAGSHKDKKRYGVTDIKGHLAAGKSKEEILNYVNNIDDDVTVGGKAQAFLASFTDGIKNGTKTPTGDTTTEIDKSINDSKNKTDESVNDSHNNTDSSVDSSYNTTKIDINTGVQGNKLGKNSAIASEGSTAIGGGNKYINKTSNDFNGKVNAKSIVSIGGNFNSKVDSGMSETNPVGDALGLYAAGAAGQTSANNPYLAAYGNAPGVPRPRNIAANYGDEALASELVFDTKGDLALNNLFGRYAN